MLYILALLGSVLFGLVLIITGAVFLVKVKNKLAGVLVVVLGLVVFLCPLAFLLSQVTFRLQG